MQELVAKMSQWIDKAGRRHVGIMVGGKRVHRILPASASARDAKRLEAEIRAAVGRKNPNIPSDPLLTDVMTLYLDYAKNLRSPETARFHALRIGRWLHGKRASESRAVGHAIVDDMAGHYAAATINRSLGTLKKALSKAWIKGITPVDYSTHVKRIPENNLRTSYPSVEQVKAIADHASGPVRAAIWIALLTGARRGEICKLTTADIAEHELTIQAAYTKTLKTRTVPIVPALRPWLKYIPLAVNFEGLKTGFRRAREAAGLPRIRYHDLRHACASILINEGVPLEVVRDVLGHASIKTTERYAHLQVGKQRQALELLGKITQEITHDSSNE